jgi:hypothetical protein
MKWILITMAALVLAACASADQDFTQGFKEAQQPLEKLLTAPNPSVSDGPAYAARMTTLADGLDDAGQKMSRLYAPAGHEQELETFVKELHASADGARAFAKAIRGRDPQRVTDAYSQYLKRLKRATDTEALLQKVAVE